MFNTQKTLSKHARPVEKLIFVKKSTPKSPERMRELEKERERAREREREIQRERKRKKRNVNLPSSYSPARRVGRRRAPRSALPRCQ